MPLSGHFLPFFCPDHGEAVAPSPPSLLLAEASPLLSFLLISPGTFPAPGDREREREREAEAHPPPILSVCVREKELGSQGLQGQVDCSGPEGPARLISSPQPAWASRCVGPLIRSPCQRRAPRCVGRPPGGCDGDEHVCGGRLAARGLASARLCAHRVTAALCPEFPVC